MSGIPYSVNTARRARIRFVLQPHRAVRKPPDRPARPLIDTIASTIGVLAPLFTLPQIVDVFRHHDVAALSLVTWVGYLVFSAFWTSYALYHKDKPLIVVNAL